MTPAQRILRTIIQVAIAVAAAVPAAAAVIPNLDAELAAKTVGVVGAFVIVVTALQNGLEAAGVLPKPKVPVRRRRR